MMRGILGLVLACTVMLGGASVVGAITFTSPNFSINGGLGNSMAGQPGSTNYKMEASGGESIIGSGASGSYKLGQGYIASLERSLQVNVQPNGLVAHWPMEVVTSGGSMYDESSNNNTGKFSTGTGTTTGKVGNAYTSSAGTEYSDVPHSASFPSGTAMTLSGWVYHNSITEDGIMSKWNYDPNNGSWAWQTTSAGNRLRMFVKASGNDVGNNYVDTTGTTLAINTWYHVAAVYDGTQANSSRVKMYINGVLQPTTTTGTIPTTLTSSTHPVRVGDFSGLNRYWSGNLDEMKIYNRVLTASEVKAEYDGGDRGIAAGVSLNSITPGTSQTSAFDTIVQTDAPGYNLAVNQNHNLQNGSNGEPDFSQDFNGFGNGTTLTTGNTGFTNLFSSGTGTFISSTSSPINSTYGRFATTTSSTDFARLTHASSSSRYYRFYMRLATIPAATQTIFSLLDNATATVSALRIQSDGTILLRDGAVTVDTSTTALASNQWVRIELHYNPGGTSQTAKLFVGSNVNGSSPNETLTGAATNGAAEHVGFGMVTAQASQTMDIDEVETSTVTWLGPPATASIPAIVGSIASPVAWSESTTKGLGFSLTAAPGLDSKWGSGANYAAFPFAGTTFYTRSGYTGGAKDVISLRARADVAASQGSGEYENIVTITGTMIP